VRVLDYDELTQEMEVQMQMLDASVGWSAVGFGRLERARELGYPASDYFGVYAVERGQIVATVRVLRLPFTTPRGTETIGSVQGVITRRDKSRRGIARMLLREVHRREKAFGCRFMMLWTGRAMIAHRLYESLGYRDVYTPDLAVKKCGKVSKPEGYELRKLRKSETSLVEEIHNKATEGRLGFTPRPKGALDAALELGFCNLDDLRVLLRRGEPVGYSVLQKNLVSSRLDELVLVEGAQSADALAVIESTLEGSWLSIRNTSVRDYYGTLSRRGYSFSPFTYYGLLAAPLEGDRSATAEALGTSDKSFTCQQLDYF